MAMWQGTRGSCQHLVLLRVHGLWQHEVIARHVIHLMLAQPLLRLHTLRVGKAWDQAKPTVRWRQMFVCVMVLIASP